MKTKRGYAIIKAAKKNPKNGRGRFRVSYIAANGELLGTSEVVENYNNAKKNIIAHMKVFSGASIIVHDNVFKNMYSLSVNGKEAFVKSTDKKF